MEWLIAQLTGGISRARLLLGSVIYSSQTPPWQRGLLLFFGRAFGFRLLLCLGSVLRDLLRDEKGSSCNPDQRGLDENRPPVIQNTYPRRIRRTAEKA
jgi:hypothetical protein